MTETKADQAITQAERHIITGHTQQAREAFRRARLFYHQDGDRDGEAIAMTRLGEVDLAANRLEEARTSLTDALALFGPESDPCDRALALHLMGELKRLDGDTRGRDHHWEEARHLYEGEGNAMGEARVLRAQARVAREGKHEDRALDLYAKALLIHVTQGHTFHEGMILREIGQYHRTLGRADLAHEALERAADLFKINGDRLDEAWSRLDLARMLRDLGDMENARRSLNVCVRLFAAAGHLGGEAETLLDLARLDAKSAPKAAERMLRQAADLARRAGLADLSDRAAREASGLDAA